MNKASVRRGLAARGRAGAWLAAVDKASEWELFPRAEADAVPAWLGIGIGATIFALGLIALACELLGVGAS
jgi:hypothetical protein